MKKNIKSFNEFTNENFGDFEDNGSVENRFHADQEIPDEEIINDFSEEEILNEEPEEEKIDENPSDNDMPPITVERPKHNVAEEWKRLSSDPGSRRIHRTFDEYMKSQNKDEE